MAQLSTVARGTASGGTASGMQKWAQVAITTVGWNEPLSLTLSPLRGARELPNGLVVMSRCALQQLQPREVLSVLFGPRPALQSLRVTHSREDSQSTLFREKSKVRGMIVMGMGKRAVSRSAIFRVWSSAFTRAWDRLKAELQTKIGRYRKKRFVRFVPLTIIPLTIFPPDRAPAFSIFRPFSIQPLAFSL